MSLAALSLALLALLLTPGPTNTLIAVAGADRGWAGALRLIPAELAGYLLAVVPLALAGAALVAQVPGVAAAITAVAAAWVLFLALRMWRMGIAGAKTGRGAMAAQVFVTTLLNPKALVIGLVLLPSPDPLLPRLAVFVALVVAVAMVWAGAGAALGQSRKGGASPWLNKAAAAWLAILSAALAAKAMGA